MKELTSYFANKSIHRTRSFLVSFTDNFSEKIRVLKERSNKFSEHEELLRERFFEIFPNFSFEDFDISEVIKEYSVNNTSFSGLDTFHTIKTSVMTFSKNTPGITNFEGFQVSINFDEDRDFTIRRLALWFTAKIMNEDGIFLPPHLNMVDEIKISLVNDKGEVLLDRIYKNCVFVSVSTPNLAYEGDGKIEYDFIFRCESYRDYFYTDSNIIESFGPKIEEKRGKENMFRRSSIYDLEEL